MAVVSSLAGPVLARPVFTVIFGNAHAQLMKIFTPAQLHRAITRAHTMPWLQQLAVSPIPRHKMMSPKSHIIQWTTSFPSAHLGERKQCPMPSNLLGLASGSGNDFTSWLSVELHGNFWFFWMMCTRQMRLLALRSSLCSWWLSLVADICK